MPYWDNLGRTYILEDTKDSADEIVWLLNEAGIDATVSRREETDLHMVTVPKDQEEAAWKLLQQHWLEEAAPREDPDEYYRRTCLKRSPNFIPSEEKFRKSTNSYILFLLAGFAVMIMALIHFILVLTQNRPEPMSECIVELLLGFFFTCYGFNSQQKVRMLETRMEEENCFTDQIVKWCTTIYSAEHLDKCIDAAADSQVIAEAQRLVLRRELIQNYILREYDIRDSAYLDFVTDLIYKRLYFPNAVSPS